MFADECSCCHAWTEPTEDNLCSDCREKFSHEWNLIGPYTDDEALFIWQAAGTPGDDGMLPADRAHGLVIRNGVWRFREDPFISALARDGNVFMNILESGVLGDKSSHAYRRFYRSMGYSLQGFMDVFPPI